MKKEIFISYSTSDGNIAKEICISLENAGFLCWIAPRDINTGLEYSECINQAIASAKLFLLILSGNAGQSKHVRREVELADRKDIKKFVVRLENSLSFGESIDYYITNIQGYEAWERPIKSKNLIVAIQNQLGDPVMKTKWQSVGGHFSERYSIDRPRTILSLDGGGIRNIITLELLLAIEQTLSVKFTSTKGFRLCDHFDYIGGSGSGVLIAVALSMGKSVKEIKNFFIQNADLMYGDSCFPFSLNFLSTPSKQLATFEKKLKTFIDPSVNLNSEDIKCLMMIMVHNHVTNAPWAITNNPLSKYNDISRPDCNLKISLLDLCYANSSWSPLAQPIRISLFDDLRSSSEISDGTFTPYNNPAYLLYQLATSNEYQVKWKTGERNLMIVSIGTGLHFFTKETDPLTRIENVLDTFMKHTIIDQDIKCRNVGRCLHGSNIDREIGDLIPRDEHGNQIPFSKITGKAFSYVRYDESLDYFERFGIDTKNIKQNTMSTLETLIQIGKYSSQQVSLSHFPENFF